MGELDWFLNIVQCDSLLEYLNPLRYVSHDQYIVIMRHLFSTIFLGFWSKLFATASLFLAFFFGVYRQRFVMGVSLYFVAILLAYGGGLAGFLFGL